MFQYHLYLALLCVTFGPIWYCKGADLVNKPLPNVWFSVLCVNCTGIGEHVLMLSSQSAMQGIYLCEHRDHASGRRLVVTLQGE